MRKPFITVRLTYGMLGALLVSTCACSGTKWTEVEKDSIRIVTQQEGAVLGYSANSGVRLLAVDGYAFKDLNRNGLLDPYEDWRLTPEERAVDLAGQLSTEEIAGLMLYSAHQSIPVPRKGLELLPTMANLLMRVEPSHPIFPMRSVNSSPRIMFVMYWLREYKAQKWRLAGIIMCKL